ncbi:hypothetical protein Patl1_26720 [Pistacia atlantica]|uniref:Uncharacterized protein n=1 Tax=Pistacia atlantica TaxID=434234 RepID=A0ACC1B391_9ROSI|nr:hypothetical protein Patl1_26720 [Pistacia atlantica]
MPVLLFSESCNFDVDDAVEKLEKLGIVSQDNIGNYTCVDVKMANEIIGTTTEEMNLFTTTRSSLFMYRDVDGIGCMIWVGDLIDVLNFDDGGNTLHICLAHSEFGGSSRLSNAAININCYGWIILLGFIFMAFVEIQGKTESYAQKSHHYHVARARGTICQSWMRPRMKISQQIFQDLLTFLWM